MASPLVSICNGALDELPAGVIQSIDDEDTGARACKRQWRKVLDDLLGEHDYDFAVRRATLALTDNDRRGEWAYCYLLPEEAVSPRRVLPSYSAAYVSTAYVLQPGQRVWSGLGFYPQNDGVPFKVANAKVYTNMTDAVLEYVTGAVEFQHFRPLFRRAFELELASRIALPVLKDAKRQKDLIGMAEVARQRAMADDLNSSPERSFDFISEEAMVRVGGMAPGYASPFLGWR